MTIDRSGTISLRRACEVANQVPPTTVRDGYRYARGPNFVLPGGPDDGSHKRFDFEGTMRIVAFERALGALSIAKAAPAVLPCPLDVFEDDVAFLVISAGMLGEDVPYTPYGAPGSKLGDGPKFYREGETEIVRGRDLLAFLANPDRHVSVVICIDEVERVVAAGWAKARGLA